MKAKDSVLICRIMAYCQMKVCVDQYVWNARIINVPAQHGNVCFVRTIAKRLIEKIFKSSFENLRI